MVPNRLMNIGLSIILHELAILPTRSLVSLDVPCVVAVSTSLLSTSSIPGLHHSSCKATPPDGNAPISNALDRKCATGCLQNPVPTVF